MRGFAGDAPHMQAAERCQQAAAAAASFLGSVCAAPGHSQLRGNPRGWTLDHEEIKSLSPEGWSRSLGGALRKRPQCTAPVSGAAPAVDLTPWESPWAGDVPEGQVGQQGARQQDAQTPWRGAGGALLLITLRMGPGSGHTQVRALRTTALPSLPAQLWPASSPASINARAIFPPSRLVPIVIQGDNQELN